MRRLSRVCRVGVTTSAMEGRKGVAGHTTTAAPTTGMGKQLAGSTSASELVWLPGSVPWDPRDANIAVPAAGQSAMVAPSQPAQKKSLASAVASEMERARQLLNLRQEFRDGCQQNGVNAPPMNTIERWLFLCKWHESQSPSADVEPLLPAGKAAAAVDATLAADLSRAGMARERARELAKSLRATAARAAVTIRQIENQSNSSASIRRLPSVQMTRLEGGIFRLTLQPLHVRAGEPSDNDDDGGSLDSGDEGDDGGDMSGTASDGGQTVSVDVTEACVDKLRVLFARGRPSDGGKAGERRGEGTEQGKPASRKRKQMCRDQGGNGQEEEDEADFRARLFVCLLRYRTVGGLGFQAAIGGTVFVALQTLLGCNFEVFASPLNTFYGFFCSAFPDVDSCFGSVGPFGAFAPVRGSYQCNPPFVPYIIDAAASHMLELLEAAQAASEPLCFAVIVPGWTDCVGYRALAEASPFLRRSLLIAAADHGFIDGGQHARRRSYRESPYDTSLFVLQTDAALARWPLTDEGMQQLEHAFASCTPSAEDLANVSTSERVHRGGAARKKRRKMKRAGKQTKARKLAKVAHGQSC